jgi:hypothetical protein
MQMIKWGVLASLALAGCGDKNLVESNRDKVNQEVSRMNLVTGDYSGDLVLKADPHVQLGKLKMNLRATTKVAPNSSDPSNAQQASLEGTVTLITDDTISLSFTNGFFDVNNGHFQLSIDVTRRDSSTVRLDVKGVAANNQLDGTVMVAQFDTRAGVFSLKRSEAEAYKASVLMDVSATSQTNPPQTWTGIRNISGEDTAIDLVIQPQAANNSEKMLRIFVPTQLWNVSVLFGGVKKYFTISNFTNALWDLRTGKLSGENAEEHSLLTCNAVQLDSSTQGWKCSYYRNGISIEDLLMKPKVNP